MKFAYHHSMCPADQYAELTVKAEQMGFDSISIPDSICYPKEGDPNYPYNADGTREFLDGVPFIEPFVLAGYLAGMTSKIRFITSVYKLAVHNPAIVAKMLSSIAVVSNNRFLFGVGISPWPEDFKVAHVPWEKRGKRMNEMMEIINGLMSGDYYGFKGDHFDLPEIKLCPVPSEKPPLLVGGHSEPALKRAARLGDGWVAAGGSAEEIEKMVNRIKELLKEYGREDVPFEYHAMTAEAYDPDGLKKLEAMGINEVHVAFRDVYASQPDDQTVEQKVGMLHWYMNEVAAKAGFK